jgi:thiol:disulfide interchange protein
MNIRQGTILGVIIAIIVISSGIFLFSQSRQSGQTAGQASVEPTKNLATQQASVEPTKNPATKQTSVEPTKNPPTKQASVDSALAQRYIPYSSGALAKAAGRTVIFFTASWCSSCRAADQDFRAHFDKVPSDVTILRADYDTETALKQKYNVTSQDTFVQVDKQGNSVTQWNSGGQGVNELLNNIK